MPELSCKLKSVSSGWSPGRGDRLSWAEGTKEPGVLGQTEMGAKVPAAFECKKKKKKSFLEITCTVDAKGDK